MKAGASKVIMNDAKTRFVYITKCIAHYEESPSGEKYYVHAYAKFGNGKSIDTDFPTEQEAMTFAENYINE